MHLDFTFLLASLASVFSASKPFFEFVNHFISFEAMLCNADAERRGDDTGIFLRERFERSGMFEASLLTQSAQKRST